MSKNQKKPSGSKPQQRGASQLHQVMAGRGNAAYTPRTEKRERK